jgi:hypothetical protein
MLVAQLIAKSYADDLDELPCSRGATDQIHHPFVKRVRFEMPYARTTILSAQMETVLLYAVH